MSAPLFDRSALQLQPLSQRTHDLSSDAILDLNTPSFIDFQGEFKNVAQKIIRAKKGGSCNIIMIGGHVIR